VLLAQKNFTSTEQSIANLDVSSSVVPQIDWQLFVAVNKFEKGVLAASRGIVKQCQQKEEKATQSEKEERDATVVAQN
jgi:hypothetical protein